MATEAGERRRIPADERRELILRVAGPLFARSGYAGARLQDVAAAAGVTKPIVYRHFGSKRGLYLALLDKHERDLPGFFERVADAPPDLPASEIARLILEHWLDYVRANSHSWVLLFRDSSGDEEIQAARRHVSERARAVLAEFIAARAAGRIPAEEVEPTAELLTSGLAGLVLWWIDHPDVPKRVLVDTAVRMSAPAIDPQR